MKKILLIIALAAVLVSVAQRPLTLKGKYVSDYATYYEFLNADTLIIGDTIEGELFHYRICPDGVMYLRDETDESTDSLTIHFSGTSDSFTIVDFSGEQTTFHRCRCSSDAVRCR